MRILVLIKQVSAPESAWDLGEGRLRPRAPWRWQMNSFDEYALEAGLGLKQSLPDLELWALTVGPASALTVLQRALGMGADQAVHLLCPEEPSPRPSQLAAWISQWAAGQDWDLILAGVISQDAQQGAVGPMVAQGLDLPLATSVVELALEPSAGRARAWQELEGGRRQELELPLPALCTIQSGPTQPRYPSLSGLLRAKKTRPLTIQTSDLADPAPREEVAALRPIQPSRQVTFLHGNTQDKAAQLLALLKQRALL